MSNHDCEWISARLPLWVDNGDCNGSIEVQGERGDLTVEERLEIELHLADCTKCSSHRVALEQALGALAIAANSLPVAPSGPSLWSQLEQRIANHQAPSDGRRRLKQGKSDPQLVQPWTKLDSVRPLSRAWTRDTLQELLAESRQKRHSKQSAGLLLKSGIAAAFLLTVSVFSLSHRQWTTSQVTIAANAKPLAVPTPAPKTTEEPSLELADLDKTDVPASQLADAEPSIPPETAPVAIEASVPKPSSRTRFGFDLEHGVPMPPDTRDAKPVY